MFRNTYIRFEDGLRVVDETFHDDEPRAIAEAKEEAKWEGTRKAIIRDLHTGKVIFEQIGDFS